MIFSWMLQPRKIKEEWVRDSVLAHNSFTRTVTRIRKKLSVINPVVNYLHPLSRHAEVGRNVPSGILADRDDCVLTMRELPRDDSPVEHALPIVFAAHVKGSQIVNGCHHTARSRPNHPAIAGH